MIINGYYDELKNTYSEVNFPIILLNKDLTVKYMNDVAQSAFGNFLKDSLWSRRYLEENVKNKIREAIEKGESVVVTPPQVKDFSALIFQPITGENGIIESIRLNVEIFSDTRRLIRERNIGFSLNETVFDAIRAQLNIIKISANMIQDSRQSDAYADNFKAIERSLDNLNKLTINTAYYFELSYRHNIKSETVFFPMDVLAALLQNESNVEAEYLSGTDSEVIFDQKAFTLAIELLMNHVKIIAGKNKIFIRAYEKGRHFVFTFEAKKQTEDLTDKASLNEIIPKTNLLKDLTEKNGGNLLIADSGRKIKIMYSIKKLIRSEYSLAFKQNDEFESTLRL